MTASDTSLLFTRYLEVVNSALEKHRDNFPYKQLAAAGDRFLGEKKLGVSVYKDDAKHPHDFFTVNFKGGSFNLVSHGKNDPDATWKVKEKHLHSVVENPQTFIEHPSKLEIDWIKSRIGLG